MKNSLIVGILMLAICFSFFAGSYVSEQEQRGQREQTCQTLMVFAVDKLDSLKKQYDADEMEACISNIYAAYEYADNAELSNALHELWNALIFDGENIAGREDALIEALQTGNTKSIREIAAGMRTIK